MELVYVVESRENVHVQGGVEWALRIRVIHPENEEGNWWVVTTWGSEPTESTVERTIKLVARSMEVYHVSLPRPRFNLKVVKYK